VNNADACLKFGLSAPKKVAKKSSHHGKRPVRFQYATQAAALPPTFLLFVSDPRGVRVAYRRYLVNQIREMYGFVGTPIRLVLKGKRAS
jgi:GTP-binding protein